MDHHIEFDVSALDIHLPHAGEIIETYRRKYTTDGAEGMPPHITLLYPFLNVHEYTQRTHNRLVDMTSTFYPFYMYWGIQSVSWGVVPGSESQRKHSSYDSKIGT